jgi:hypothetical protein
MLIISIIPLKYVHIIWAVERVKKDVNAKLTTNFIKYTEIQNKPPLKQNQQTHLQNQQSPMQNQRSPMQKQQSFTELSPDGVQKNRHNLN